MNSTSLTSLFLLVRPGNLLLAAATVVVAAMLAGAHGEHVATVGLAAVACALIAGGGYALNDVCDLESDRTNHPRRPIVTGSVTPQQAVVVWSGLTIVGLFLASLAGDRFFVIAMIWVVALFVYSIQWKKTALAGNILVSGIAALAVYFGAAATVNVEAARTPALFAFLANLAREIVKDVEDVAGDRLAGAQTLPVQAGERKALLAALAPLGLLIVATLEPFIAGRYGGFYLGIVAVADAILAYCMLFIVRSDAASNLSRLSALIKMSMAIGVLALFSVGW